MKDVAFAQLAASVALSRPLHEIAIELTVYCNLRCKMCSVWELREHGVSFKRVSALLRDAHELGARTFTPCGAESFMRKDFLDIVELAHGLGYHRQDVVTNGTLLEDRHLDRLQGCPSVVLHVSLDGPRALHDELRGEGTYDKAVATVRACLERGIEVGLSGVILRESMAHLDHVVTLAAQLGIGEVCFQPFQAEISGPDKDIERFSLRGTPREEILAQLERLREHADGLGVEIFTESLFGVIPDYLVSGARPIPPGGCHLPSKFLLVDFRGDVYPCFFMRTDADRMGNVSQASITDLWHSMHHRQLQTLALTERCPGCLAACSDVEAFARSTERAPSDSTLALGRPAADALGAGAPGAGEA